MSCLQHRLIDLVKHGWHFLLLNFFTFKIFFVTKNLVTPDYVSKIFVSFECQNWRNSKISFNFGSICKICYFLSIIVLRSGRFLLYVTASGKYSILDVLILFSNSFLGIVIAQLICIVVSVFFLFFLSGFSFTTIYESQNCREGGRHFFNSSLPFPPASQTLRHYPGDYCRELTPAHR